MSGIILQWLFLYFPEDKTEYIPAFITTAIFLAGAVLTMRFFIRHSRKEAEEAEKLQTKQKKNE
ncbi:hypothetical protein GCM10008967_16200 [Bacillus carboniphilus]|uniref:Uncharacterized protein n=1 Tax=Bacillus carboniphilus TaxID=86663 RepID=A0ABP3FX48_9BACI